MSNKRYLDTESMIYLINEVTNYQESLANHRMVLQNAAITCDAVLGGEAISKKYVTRVAEVVEAIDIVKEMVEHLKTVLSKELQHAIDIYNE